MSEQSFVLKGRFNIAERVRQDSRYFRRILILGLPIATQNLVQSLLNMVDTLMIGQLGEVSIAAVALSNQVFFLMMLLIFGISSGSAVFTAQFWGKKDMEGIHRTMGMGLILGLAGGALFTLGAQFFPAEILGLFSKDEKVIEAGIPYLRTVSYSYVFTALTILIQGVLRSTGEVRIPLIFSVGALSLNAVFNYGLIFGRLGLPELGIRGAALATAGARTLETLALLIYLYRSGHPVAASPAQLFRQNCRFTGRFFHKVTPVILNEVGWSMGITMFTLIFARMGTEVIAAYNIMETFSRLTFVFFQGSGFATAIVLGNMIGAGEKEHSIRLGKTILMLVPLLGLLTGLISFLLAPWIPHFFKISVEAASLVTALIRIFGLVMFIKVSNMHIIIGLLRSGGDTHVGAALELLPMWLVSIPLAALAGLVFHLPPPLVYLVCLSEELLKYVAGLLRIRSGKWVHDLT